VERVFGDFHGFFYVLVCQRRNDEVIVVGSQEDPAPYAFCDPLLVDHQRVVVSKPQIE
jgi:hypothetical protein